MGRQGIDWKEVEEFLWEYVDKEFEIIDTADVVYVGDDFPNEFKGAIDTIRLKVHMQKRKQMLPHRFQCSGWEYAPIRTIPHCRWQHRTEISGKS